MLSIGNYQVKFEIKNYTGIVAVTSTLIAFSSIITDVANENPIVSIKNTVLTLFSAGSWGYTLATKSSKVFAKTIKTDLSEKKLTPEQKFSEVYKLYCAAKKQLEGLQALSKGGDLCDESVLTEEIESFEALELELRTLFNGLNKAQQKSYIGLSFLRDKDSDDRT